MSEELEEDFTVELPIDGTLDLHTFKPREIGSLIPEYLQECLLRNIFHVRIIHGKGSGALRKGVHAVLKRTACVQEYSLADETGGSWGATIVKIAKQ